MKINFTISGVLLDEEGKGVEGSLSLFGYEEQGYLNTKEDGSFTLNITNCSCFDMLFKKHLVVWIKTGENKFEGKMGYDFRICPNKHVKLRIYPFSKRIIRE
ncbi:MAG: hypothetical protein A2Y00_08935 [Omnitrophica WOR_2 bacterium GWF2_43_52]|nr:MAG: hypothetical protein A2Y01_01450 [Omnitrophica WOR_2 bacterium GWC2_44_8]OGX21219.1 MAG: hypothetical protein A2Y00_08935 [Omnitrophica WOR_2 bacterium GWF2_43_52]HAH20455.1 hypothetical protein [Candidatus Omnitrophota bacterium]HBG62824.1 hypothetical protein [Candidatus Omnitrophota bacterium]